MLQIMKVSLFQDGLIVISQILQGQSFLMIVKTLASKDQDLPVLL